MLVLLGESRFLYGLFLSFPPSHPPFFHASRKKWWRTSGASGWKNRGAPHHPPLIFLSFFLFLSFFPSFPLFSVFLWTPEPKTRKPKTGAGRR